MAPRRLSTRQNTSTGGTTRGTRGGVRKNTRTRQPPNRYGHHEDPSSITIASATPSQTPSVSEGIEPSTPEYGQSPGPPSRIRHPTQSSATEHTPQHSSARVTPAPPSEQHNGSSSPASTRGSINIDTMRELLRSHEQDIINRVVLQLSSQNPTLPPATDSNFQALPPTHTGTQPLIPSPTQLRISELERQLSQLRAQQELQHTSIEPSAVGTFNPTQPLVQNTSESASSMMDSVEMMFPGVERGTLVQIIENRFKPTNIYRLLATEKERAETRRTINIGGVEFEQAEREGKESEYRMTSFFKAWAVYSGILIKLAPYALQGELATGLCIYTMNLYELLEKYTWEGVKSYHFQFHRKRVASGKNIFQPGEWRQLDSELVASKCFAYPVPRPTWTQSPKAQPPHTRRIYDLPMRDSAPGPSYASFGPPATSVGPQPSQAPPCRNWNFRECRSALCRYQHSCITCGSSHRAVQCTAGNTGTLQQTRKGLHGR